jgi:peroxiredoxin
MNSIEPKNVELLSLDDVNINLSDLLSSIKKNILLFYNTNCLGCTGRAIPFAYDLLQKNKSKMNIVVIHVDFGGTTHSKEEILSIFHSKISPIPIFKDIKASLYNKLNCEGTPHWILLSENGEVLNSVFGSQDNAQMRLEYMMGE